MNIFKNKCLLLSIFITLIFSNFAFSREYVISKDCIGFSNSRIIKQNTNDIIYVSGIPVTNISFGISLKYKDLCNKDSKNFELLSFSNIRFIGDDYWFYHRFRHNVAMIPAAISLVYKIYDSINDKRIFTCGWVPDNLSNKQIGPINDTESFQDVWPNGKTHGWVGIYENAGSAVSLITPKDSEIIDKFKFPAFTSGMHFKNNGFNQAIIESNKVTSIQYWGKAITSDIKFRFKDTYDGNGGYGANIENPYLVPLPIDNIKLDKQYDKSITLTIFNSTWYNNSNKSYYYREANVDGNNEAGWYETSDPHSLNKVNIAIPVDGMFGISDGHTPLPNGIDVYIKSPYSKEIQGDYNSKIYTVEKQIYGTSEIFK